MGTTLGEAGDAQRASQILSFAVQFYPKDASAQFNLALTLGKRPAAQIEAFRRAIDLDPDMVAAYQSLGAALYSAGQAQGAIDVFHQGLQIDPLSAILYYDLGLALQQQGDAPGAAKALKLASKLDPEIATRKPAVAAIQ
jgi:superkiller protein 3